MNAKFLSYLIKRLFMALLTIFLVVAITFFVMHAIPASPFSSEKAKSDAVIAALEAKYGFDKPVPVQFLNYLKNIEGEGRWTSSSRSRRPPSSPCRPSSWRRSCC